MFELDITREFSGAHALRGYNGDCQCLHGHNWIIQVFVQSAELDQIGIAVDFKVLKKELDAILTELDHKYLNELEAFRDCNPTSENLARIIYKELGARLNDDRVRVTRISVEETPGSRASYFE